MRGIGLLFVIVGIAMLVNHQADQKTLQDCASKGEATMMGGGSIKCEVKKERKPAEGGQSHE